MDFNNRVCQKLHEEHVAALAMMNRLSGLLASHREAPPAAGDSAVSRLLTDLTADLEAELWRHFDFEEEHLFPYLADAGNAAIGAHLTSEHESIRPVGAEVIKMARAANPAGFDAANWQEFRKLAQELVELLVPHAQKEEMALVPMLEHAMDPETEAWLYEKYVTNR
jgi:DUF438 domain-containing protein